MPEPHVKAVIASIWAAKLLGSLAGVLISMAMVAPEGTRSAVYRCILGTIAGIIFSPTMMRLVPFFAGETWEDWLAASAATGFSIWFILEMFARWLSSPETGNRLIAWIEKRMGRRDK